ncbi:MAG: nucleotidyltransferase [Flavisolibacter sp.]|nr:nucleotidyltransferase [Flavisolibacter sp.]
MGDYQIFETTPFIPGWVDFPLQNGVRLDIMTALKGVELSFDECLHQAPVFNVEGVQFHCLHINHLIAKKSSKQTKRSVGCIRIGKNKKLKRQYRCVIDEVNERIYQSLKRHIKILIYILKSPSSSYLCAKFQV